MDFYVYTVLQKKVAETDTFIFYNNFSKRGSIFIIFTIKVRKDLRRKTALKLPPPLKYVASILCEK